MNYEYQYNIGSCPLCKQGYLEIVKEQETNVLFICCDECMGEWESPEDALLKRNGSRLKFGKVVEPTFEEICSVNWQQYIQKHSE